MKLPDLTVYVLLNIVFSKIIYHEDKYEYVKMQNDLWDVFYICLNV